MFENWRKIDIVFVRHAESYNNCLYDVVKERNKDIVLSMEEVDVEVDKLRDPDCGCSARGMRQCQSLRKYIKDGGWNGYIGDVAKWKLYSSPMKRCLITSGFVSEAYSNKPVSVIPFLYESDGCYSTTADGKTVGCPGMTAEDVHKHFPSHRCVDGMENGWYSLPEKETRRQFLQRSEHVASWLWDLHSQSPDERGFQTGAVLVIHGNLIGAVISSLLKSSILIAHNNTGFTHIELWSDPKGEHKTPSIQYINRLDHLLHPAKYPDADSEGEQVHADGLDLICGADVFNDHWIQEFIPNSH